MALTDENLESERPHPSGLGGIQRTYRFASGYGLSLVNSPMIHHYPFAWEAAVLDKDDNLDYTTELTDDVEVFQSDEDANAFIARAKKLFDVATEVANA